MLLELFKKRLEDISPEYYEEIISIIEKEEKKKYTFRLNPKKLSEKKLHSLFSDSTLQTISFIDDVFCTENKQLYTKHPLFLSGAYYFQDLSSMLPVLLLNLEADDRILDFCAAPGSKSTQILSLLNDTHLFFANEVTRSRVGKLLYNIGSWGVSPAIVASQEVEVYQKLTSFFSKVIIDAPCSGEGMFFKNKDYIPSWKPSLIKKCTRTQKRILQNILPSIKENGELIYSTCTMAPEENEEVIEWLLEKYPESIQLVDISDKISVGSNGLTKFQNREYHPTISQYAKRIFPYHKQFYGESFFIAKLKITKHISSVTSHTRKRYTSYNEIPKQKIKSFLESFNIQNMPIQHFYCLGYYLYYHPSLNKDLLRDIFTVIHPHYLGVRVGKIKKDRIEPSVEWASSMPELFSADNQNYLDLSLYDIQQLILEHVILISHNETDGYYAIGYQKLPIGFGKLTAGRLEGLINYEQAKKLYL